MTQDQWMKEAERLAMDFAHCYAFVGDDTMPKAKAALLAHLQQRHLPVREGTTILDVGFKYENGVHTPTVLIGFAPNDYDARDAFARAMRSPSLPVREEPTPVLNALQVLERMDYRPGDRVLVEHFLSVLWARGMWVIESPLASSTSVQNMGEGETGKDGAPSSGKSHQWEDADDLTLARAEVLSLVGLLAELGRMEAGNADDALGGYCGAPVADFKRRCREAVARNGGVDLHDGAKR